ncbi:MAG: RidA family protein [Paracoccaceae bacterium]
MSTSMTIYVTDMADNKGVWEARKWRHRRFPARHWYRWRGRRTLEITSRSRPRPTVGSGNA